MKPCDPAEVKRVRTSHGIGYRKAVSTVLLVTVACPASVAEPLALHCVSARLAACVAIIPGVRSVYRWQGEVETADEVLLQLKTTDERFDALRATLLERHPYELPEILAVPVTAAHPPYIDWIIDQTR